MSFSVLQYCQEFIHAFVRAKDPSLCHTFWCSLRTALTVIFTEMDEGALHALFREERRTEGANNSNACLSCNSLLVIASVLVVLGHMLRSPFPVTDTIGVLCDIYHFEMYELRSSLTSASVLGCFGTGWLQLSFVLCFSSYFALSRFAVLWFALRSVGSALGAKVQLADQPSRC